MNITQDDYDRGPAPWYMCPRCMRQSNFFDYKKTGVCPHCGDNRKERLAKKEAKNKKRRAEIIANTPVSSRETPYERMGRWWDGKLCRPRGSSGEFKRVSHVHGWGPASGFYMAGAELVYEDGTREAIPFHGAYRPRKKDVEIQDIHLVGNSKEGQK
ncbi:unnamed protein product [marine sediment metagenome]|uniref:Uncharacterized protein n=1 Tax=marine sediment metagenome TaxID=412755 RepID=X0YR51_9ZZZZ